jgi:hypothetical protein
VFNALNVAIDLLDWYDGGESLWTRGVALTPALAPFLAFASAGIGRLTLYGLGLLALYLVIRDRPPNINLQTHTRRSMAIFSAAVLVVVLIGYFAAPNVQRIDTFTIVAPHLAEVGLRLTTTPPTPTTPSKVDFLPLAVADGSRTRGNEFKNLFAVVLVVRVRDAAVDFRMDPLISRSRSFEIRDGRVEMNVIGGGKLASVTNPAGGGIDIEFYLLCVPKRLGREFQTIGDALAKGAVVCHQGLVPLRYAP